MINEKITKIQRKQLDYNFWKFGVEIEADWGTEEKMNSVAKKLDAVVTDTYHGAEEYKGIRWVFEPDMSIQVNPDDVLPDSPDFVSEGFVYEGVSPILDIYELEKALQYIFPLIKTNETMGMHVSMSNKNINFLDFDWLKFMLFFEEGYLYSKFPSRKNSKYASSMNEFLEKLMNTRGYIKLMREGKLTEISTQCKKWIQKYAQKMYGINFIKNKKGYVEFRYLGGAHYNEKYNEIMAVIEMWLHTFNLVLSDSNKVEYHNKLQRFMKVDSSLSKIKMMLVDELDEEPYRLDLLFSEDRINQSINAFTIIDYSYVYDPVEGYSDGLEKNDTAYKNFVRRLGLSSTPIKYISDVDKKQVKHVFDSPEYSILDCINILLSYKLDSILSKLNIAEDELDTIIADVFVSLKDFARDYIESKMDTDEYKDKYTELLIKSIEESASFHNTSINSFANPSYGEYYDMLTDILGKGPIKLEIVFKEPIMSSLLSIIKDSFKVSLANSSAVSDKLVKYIKKNAYFGFNGVLSRYSQIYGFRLNRFFIIFEYVLFTKVDYVNKHFGITPDKYNEIFDPNSIKEKVIDIAIDYLTPFIQKASKIYMDDK